MPSTADLTRALAVRLAEWLPPGWTLETRHHETGDTVEVRVERPPKHGEARRSWCRSFNRAELDRGIDQAAGAVLHQAGLERCAFRVWRGERAAVETAGAALAGEAAACG